MRLIEALRILNAARASENGAAAVYLACGFTPLHLQTLLTAHLQQRSASHRILCEVGLFGDLVGNIGRASQSSATAAAVVVEWNDLDARLGLRAAGGWSPSAHDSITDSVRHVLQRVEDAILRLAERVPVAVCLPTLALPPIAFTTGWEASALELTLHSLVADSARRLAGQARVHVLSQARLDRTSPPAARADVAGDLATGFPFSLGHADALAQLLAELLRPRGAKKGLITDLDDTVWLGILGDVGVDGVVWGLEHHAQVHALYQQLLGSLADAGALVAVASKNDAALVGEALARGDMLLKPAQLFPIVANWQPKSEAVATILEAWNIGPESVVMVDDSAMELAEVHARFPDITCLVFPKDDPAAVVQLLNDLRDAFGKSEVLDDDRIRRESLRSASAVRELRAGGGTDTEAFLSQAESVVSLRFSKDRDDRRPFELLNKTNQFNLNGDRLSEGEWLSLLNADDSFVMSVGYRDKYGPLGTIAVVAGRLEGETVVVQHWVMSCRAFARRIEHQCLKALFERLGAAEVRLDYRQTPRNGPTREFLSEFFELDGSSTPLSLHRAEFDARCRPTYHTLDDGVSAAPVTRG